jgi:hypothetical protein
VYVAYASTRVVVLIGRLVYVAYICLYTCSRFNRTSRRSIKATTRGDLHATDTRRSIKATTRGDLHATVVYVAYASTRVVVLIGRLVYVAYICLSCIFNS